MTIRRCLLSVLACVLLVAGSAYAQTTAQITGAATTGGAPLPGVTVTITSPQMQGSRTAVTGDAGGYNFAGVPPGTYSVRFDLSGMNTVTKEVRVGVGQTGRADAEMQVTAVTEAITVTAAAPTVLETPTAAQNISSNLTHTLPTNRTVIGTAALAPGVNTNTAGNTGSPNSQVSISGSPGYDNLVMVNGVVITEDVRSQALPLFIEDAIQETTVMTGAISAEYGRFTGGVINSISKSGGNQFSGSYRESLNNPTWTSRTPLQLANHTRIRDVTGKIDQETLGGFIVKDRLWFFAAHRGTKGDIPGSLRAVPGTTNPLQVDTLSVERRWEGKLTGQITPKHNLMGSYLKTDSKQTDSFFSATSYDQAQLVPRHDPYWLKTANYNGILTNNWLIEGLWSKMFWGVAWGSGATASDFINGTLVRNRADGNARFNSATFCGVCDKETRTNGSWNAKTSYFLSTKSLGNMSIVGGIEDFQEHRHSNNYQSGSNFRLFVNSVQSINGVLYPTLTPGTANSATFLIWTPIFDVQQGESDLATKSAFVNNRWDLNDRWSFNVGVRYDKNDAVDGSGNRVANDSRFTPRLSATRDLTGNGKHRLTASFSEYSSRIVDGPATLASSAGSPAYIYYYYLGPAINPAGTAPDKLLDTHAALQVVQNWLNSQCLNGDPTKCGTANTSLIRATGPRGTPSQVPGATTQIGNLSSPYVREYSLGYGAEWSPTFVTRADLIFRDWRDFYSFRTDQSTSQITDRLGVQHDVAVVENTNLISRKYRGLQFQAAWHPNRLNVGFNYTYSTLKGNDYQETANNGTVGNAPGQTNYPELLNYPNAQPNGYLPQDERHRVRAWVSYEVPAPQMLGNITLSLLQNVDSGLSYSALGSVDLTPYMDTLLPANSHYVAPPGSGTYFYSKPGEYRLPTVQSTNLSLQWEKPIWHVALYAHVDYINVLNRHNVVDPFFISTTVNSEDTSGNFAPFNPFTQKPVECPQGTPGAQCLAMGKNWQKVSNFGTPVSSSAYQQPRTYAFNFGLRF